MIIQKPSLKFRRISSDFRLKWLALFLTGAFLASSVQRFWVHPSGGHTHRQSDTIGMSIAFAEQLKERGWAGLDFLIYPRILQRGVLDGINASEFPLLNAMSVPGFLLSADPWTGVFLTSLLILLLNLYAAAFSLPKFLRAWKVEISGPLCLLLWLTGRTVASRSNTIMPEGVAFPLMIIGMVQLVGPEVRRRHLVWGMVICSLAIAAKPTLVIALGAVLVLPFISDQWRGRKSALLISGFLSLLFPAWWFAVHAKDILKIAEGPQIFALAAFDPIRKLGEVGPWGVLSLLRRESFGGQLPIFVGWFFVAVGFIAGEWVVASLYLLSLVAAISLDGAHIYVHNYYFIGTSVFAIILMARVLGTFEDRKFLKILTIAFLTWGVLYNTRINVWTWARDSRYWQVNYWKMGTDVRKIISTDFLLITDDGPYPQKLLFIGRKGVNAGDQVYDSCKEARYRSLSLAMVSDTPPPQGGDFCENRPKEYKTVVTSFAKWYVTLVR